MAITPRNVYSFPTKAEGQKTDVKKIGAKDYNGFVKILGTLERIPCPYCGNDTLTMNKNDYWICSHCECPIYGPSLPENAQGGEAAAISNINSMIERGDYQSAVTEYDKLIKDHGTAAHWYRYGMLYVEYSNAEVSAIKYDRKGFMEENSEHREKAGALLSKAKLLLYKALRVCQNSFDQEVADPQTAFIYVMASTKLGDPRGIKKGLAILMNMKSDMLIEYGGMMLSVTLADHNNVILHADKILTQDLFSVNALYYMAWALFKKGKANDAMKILKGMSIFIHTPSMDGLVKEIEAQRLF